MLPLLRSGSVGPAAGCRSMGQCPASDPVVVKVLFVRGGSSDRLTARRRRIAQVGARLQRRRPRRPVPTQSPVSGEIGGASASRPKRGRAWRSWRVLSCRGAVGSSGRLAPRAATSVYGERVNRNRASGRQDDRIRGRTAALTVSEGAFRARVRPPFDAVVIETALQCMWFDTAGRPPALNRRELLSHAVFGVGASIRGFAIGQTVSAAGSAARTAPA